MKPPMMPKATAIWLIDNTALTFEQIADFCGLHSLEVKAIADGEIAMGMAPIDPVSNHLLSQDEIERCSKDPDARLQALESEVVVKFRKKGGRYTPVAKRQDKPNAIAWVLKHHSEISTAQICRFLGTTKATIEAIRNKTHWNYSNIQAKSPVSLELCTQEELAKFLEGNWE